MKNVVLSVVAAAAIGAGAPALAADMPAKAKPAPAVAAPSPLDVAFGGVIMSDYNFRGISQSNRGASAGGYVEPQFNIGFGTLYVGLAGYAIDWPGTTPQYGFTSPSAEIDLYGGWRNSWGAFSVDLGLIYYYYPKETFNGFTANSDFYEIYAKLGYAITPDLSIGVNAFYTPDLLNYSETFATGGISQNVAALYLSGTAKWVTPLNLGPVGTFISGELGHWLIDDSVWTASGLTDPSYTYWNAGIGFTWKALTLDLRYHGTDQSVQDCANFLLVGVGNASNNWCDDTFIASIKFDTMMSALK